MVKCRYLIVNVCVNASVFIHIVSVLPLASNGNDQFSFLLNLPPLLVAVSLLASQILLLPHLTSLLPGTSMLSVMD